MKRGACCVDAGGRLAHCPCIVEPHIEPMEAQVEEIVELLPPRVMNGSNETRMYARACRAKQPPHR